MRNTRITREAMPGPTSRNGHTALFSDEPRNFKDFLERYRDLHKKQRYKAPKMEMIGRSLSVKQVRAKINRAARDERPVLIFGETGTGKEVVARLIHRESGRSRERFEVVNCSTFDTPLVNDEVFGHEKGSFSSAYQAHKGMFEVADKGVLFLDEITEMTLSVQAKLLRAVEDGEVRRIGGEKTTSVDVRVIAGTNQDLAEYTKTGKFRLDLFFRIARQFIHLPPLRERGSDILELAAYYLAYFEGECEAARGTRFTVHHSVLDKLMRHEWRGNIRELIIVIENAVVTAALDEDDRIREEYIEWSPIYSQL